MAVENTVAPEAVAMEAVEVEDLAEVQVLEGEPVVVNTAVAVTVVEEASVPVVDLAEEEVEEVVVVLDLMKILEVKNMDQMKMNFT